MSARKNCAPANVWDALRRLRNCNKGQLAAALGVTRQTLSRWEALEANGENAGEDAHHRAAQLMQATLMACDAQVHAMPQINWDAVSRIGGRR